MLRRFMVVVAWVVAVGMLAAFALVAVLHWPGIENTSSIMTITAGGRDYTAFGLRYVGIGGMVLVACEALLVLAGIVLSVFHATTPRRVGHAILTAWSVLLLADAVYLAVAAAAGLTMLRTVLLIGVPALACAATVTRAGLAWTRRREP